MTDCVHFVCRIPQGRAGLALGMVLSAVAAPMGASAQHAPAAAAAAAAAYYDDSATATTAAGAAADASAASASAARATNGSRGAYAPPTQARTPRYSGEGSPARSPLESSFGGLGPLRGLLKDPAVGALGASLLQEVIGAARSSGSTAPQATPYARSTGSVQWARAPSGEDIARYHPDRAMRQGVNGEAKMFCAVKATGGLEDCSVISESPEGHDFGGAALRLSHLFRAQTTTRDGYGPPRIVPVHIRFRLPIG